VALRFNPPPGWPAPPAGFVPDAGWQPDPSWPPAPPGWQLWVSDDVPGVQAAAGYGLPGLSAEAVVPGPSAEAGVWAPPIPPSPATEPLGWAPPSPVPAMSGQPGPGWAAQAAPPSGTSGMAVAAFVLGLLGFLVITALVGIVLGSVAVSRVRKSLQGGKTLAILGIVFGAGWLVLLGALFAVGAIVGSFTVSTTNVPGSQEVPATSLATGDCFDWPSSFGTQGVTFIEETPCGQPHNSQVVATFEASGSSGRYPGATRLSALAERGCPGRVKGAVDSAKVNDLMSGRFLYPLAGSWLGGQRDISCVIYSPTSLRSSILKR
jgi:Domain of unknown function (DUF4190)/Septum formation